MYDLCNLRRFSSRVENFPLLGLSGYCFCPWCLDGRSGGWQEKFVQAVSQKLEGVGS